MNILITGGCGFIGINLIEYLQKNRSDSVIILDNLTLGKKEYVSDFDVQFIEGDIRDQDLVHKVLRGVDIVVHLAADTRVINSIENPDFNFDVNVKGTYHLLRASHKANIERFVFASTGGAIIGDAEPPVNEYMVPKPLSPYGASKLCGESYCSAFAGSYGIKTVSLRFSNVYGPHSYHKGSVVAAFFKMILKEEPLIVFGDGYQTRDFVFSEDICSAIYNAINADYNGDVFQLGSGRATSINDLISQMRQVVGKKYDFDILHKPPRLGEVRYNYADIRRAKMNINYLPKVDLITGLERTWAWFLQQSGKN